mmetsp:Transcript_29870/g.45645  ORF Transcript_29870/g.45645 Transcript_29870/m.45645 type:complete len:218 (-) Transcript_29870:3558-4211(-)
MLQELVDLLLQHLVVHGHFLENLDARIDHEVVDGLGVLVTGPHDSLELQPRVDEGLGVLSEDALEERRVKDDIQVDPVPLGIDPDLQVVVHRFQLRDPGQDVLLDVRSELRLRDDFERVQVLLDGLVQGLSVHHDVGVLGVLEGDDLQLELLPLVADALEDSLVLSLGVGVFDDLVDLLLVVLDVVVPEVNDREFVLALQVRRLDQVKDLHPVAGLQ